MLLVHSSSTPPSQETVHFSEHSILDNVWSTRKVQWWSAKKKTGESGTTKSRPSVLLFGDSITEQSFKPGGWGLPIVAEMARKVRFARIVAGAAPGLWLAELGHRPQGQEREIRVGLWGRQA